jgi:hypothetical protein
MAAHGLTILKQIANRIETAPDMACDYAFAATSAPGTCAFTAGFSMDTWDALDRVGESRDLATLRDAVAAGIERHAWMDKFRTLEEVRAFLMSNTGEVTNA